HSAAVLLLILFSIINLKKTLPHLLDPSLTSAGQPYDGPTLAAAVRFASTDQNTPVILISGDSHPSLWYYADRPIKMNIWSVDQFKESLTDNIADLPFYYQQQCPARPIAVLIPRLYSNAANDHLNYLPPHYQPLNPPLPISD